MASRIVLKASEVAAIVGRNRYKPRSEVFDEMWKKYRAETFKGKTKSDKALEALSHSVSATKVLSEATLARPKNSTETMALVAAAEQKVKSDPTLDSQQKADVIEHIRAKVYTSHGTRSEDKTSESVEVSDTFKAKPKTQEAVDLSTAATRVMGDVARVHPKNSGETKAFLLVAEEKINSDSKLNVEQKADVVRHIRATVHTKEALTVSPEATSVVRDVSVATPKTVEESVALVREAEIRINSDPKLNIQQKADVVEHIRTTIQSSENRSRYNRDDAFYSIPVCTIDDVAYVIVGKIDRVEVRPDGTRVLVEIKNRTRALFHKVVDYEFIQVQTYLQMLGLEHARLVEQFNDQVNSMEVTKDQKLWDAEIMPGLNTFCQELHTSMFTCQVQQ